MRTLQSRLITQVMKQEWTIWPVGDAKHYWGSPRNGEGTYLLDAYGNVLHGGQPLVKHRGYLTPMGDARRAFVKDNGHLFVVGLSPQESKNTAILPAGWRAMSLHATGDGAWVNAVPEDKKDDDEREEYRLFFVSSRTLEVERTVSDLLMGADQVTAGGRTLFAWETIERGDGRYERFPDHRSPPPPITYDDISVTVLDPKSWGIVTLDVPPPAFARGHGSPQISVTPEGRYLWMQNNLHSGVSWIDVDQALRAVRAHQRYRPRLFLEGKPARLRVGPDRSVWIFEERSYVDVRERPGPSSLLLIDDGETPSIARQFFFEERIEEVVPVSSDACLVQLRSQSEEARVEYVARSGERRVVSEQPALKHGIIMFGGEPWVTYSDRIGANVLLYSTHIGVLHFEVPSRKLTVLEGDPFGDGYVQPDREHIWIVVREVGAQYRGIARWDRATGKVADEPMFTRFVGLPFVRPVGDGVHALAWSREIGTCLIDTNAAPLPLALTLGETRLLTGSEPFPARVAFDPGDPQNAHVRVDARAWPNHRLSPATRVRADVSWDGGSLVLESPEFERIDENIPLHIVRAVQGGDPFASPVTLRVLLTDAYGSRMATEWTGFRFVQPTPVVQRDWFRSIVIFIVLVLLAAGGAALRGSLQRWAPLAVLAVGGGGFVTSAARSIDGRLLLILIAATFVFGLMASLLSPRVFRELEAIEPYRSLAPAILSIGPVRRRLYGAYVRRVRDDIAQARTHANVEIYLPLPIREIGARHASLPAGEGPPDRILARLTERHGDARANVLIESPGGRGKSALLRATVVAAADAFLRDPKCALPIICESDDGDLYERARVALGTDGFSDELLRALMRAGEFFLVIDGLTESTITPAMVQDYAARFGTMCPMLVSSRPSQRFQRAFEATSAWLVVEPLPLYEETLPTFIRTYGGDPSRFGDEVKRACRNESGEYLPVLVRLALLAPEGHPRTINDVYESAVRQLLRSDGLFDEAVALCLETYWVDGERKLVFSTADEQRKKLLVLLRNAGLLVPVDRSIVSAESRTLRFFHDSIQSYLTAVGLSRCDESAEVLLRAAGEERFAREHSEAGAASELFEMYLHVFEPQEKLRELLREQLLDYAERFGGSFSRDWIVERSGIEVLGVAIASDVGGGTALRMAIDVFAKQSDIRFIGALYANVVRQIWTKLHRTLDDRP